MVGGRENPLGVIRVDVNKELKFCENSKKKSGWGVGVRVDVNVEVNFFVKIQQQKLGEGGRSGWI